MKKLILVKVILFASMNALSFDNGLVNQLESTKLKLLREVNRIERTLDVYYSQQSSIMNINHELLDFYYNYQYKKQFNLVGNLSGSDSYVGQRVALLKDGFEVASTITEKKHNKIQYKFKQRLFPREDLRRGFTIKVYSERNEKEKEFKVVCTAGENNQDQCGL